MTSIEIRGLGGLGDNVYQRPLVRAACEHYDEVYLETPWPELYRDLPRVFPTRFTLDLRTQQKNVVRQKLWHTAPECPSKRARIKYGIASLEGGSIMESLAQCVPYKVSPFVFDLPHFGPPPIQTNAPIAVVRPCTVRGEWPAPARNCDPAYMARAVEILHSEGYHVVSIADLECDKEWLHPGPTYEADTTFHEGELLVEQMCALVEHASVVVAPVGFIVPMAMAYRTPLVVIAGGALGLNSPAKVMDHRITSPTSWLVPDKPCHCTQITHMHCGKTIADFDRRFMNALSGVMTRQAA